jgi:hypothetical protein
VRNTVTGNYQSKVHVKVVGSTDGRFISGETDLRGVFIADDVRGKVTIIARDAANRYAFYCGEQWLGAAEAAKQEQQNRPMPSPRESMDYRRHLNRRNRAIQSLQIKTYDQMRRSAGRGVRVQNALE